MPSSNSGIIEFGLGTIMILLVAFGIYEIMTRLLDIENPYNWMMGDAATDAGQADSGDDGSGGGDSGSGGGGGGSDSGTYTPANTAIVNGITAAIPGITTGFSTGQIVAKDPNNTNNLTSTSGGVLGGGPAFTLHKAAKIGGINSSEVSHTLNSSARVAPTNLTSSASNIGGRSSHMSKRR